MKLITNLYAVCLGLFLAAFCSCQKVIKVNLNSSNPRYVVQGNVTDQPGPYFVTITKSINFDQDNVFPAVSGATVVITDRTNGVIDTLKEANPGSYQTSVMHGISGHQYDLYINAANNIFTASCIMPAAVAMDSLYTEPSPFGGDGRRLVPVYTDPVAKGNYYHFSEIKNDTLTDNISIHNDQLINGQVENQPVGGRVQLGDHITLTLECIDSAIYQYYYGLAQTQNQNSATPANPISNIKGGALGYFSAHTASTRSIVVTP